MARSRISTNSIVKENNLNVGYNVIAAYRPVAVEACSRQRKSLNDSCQWQPSALRK
jgi:hypothetical protein